MKCVLRCKNTLPIDGEMTEKIIKLIPYHPKRPPPRWKCPKKFKLALGSPWESSDSEDDDKKTDELLCIVTQQYEEQELKKQLEKDNDDESFLMESQQYEEQAAHPENNAKDISLDVASTKSTLDDRFGSPKSTAQVESVRKSGVPAKSCEQNVWASSVWHVWAKYRRSIEPVEEEEQQHVLEEDFSIMTVPAMNFWLCKFVLEVRRKDGKPYAPDTVYQICCALLRLLKDADRAEVNILTNPKFTKFRGTLDARMNQPRKAETISEIHEICCGIIIC